MTASLQVEVQIAPGAPDDLSTALVEELTRYTLERRGALAPRAVNVLVTDDATIQRLHADHMGIDESTDVLTFTMEDDNTFLSAEATPLLGDIVVSFETAAANAREYGHTTTREICFLVVHGLLHLLGYDDSTPAERAHMLAEQETILTAFERETDAAR